MSTMGSFSMKGTLNAASCADMVVEMVDSDGCKFRPFKLLLHRNLISSNLMLTMTSCSPAEHDGNNYLVNNVNYGLYPKTNIHYLEFGGYSGSINNVINQRARVGMGWVSNCEQHKQSDRRRQSVNLRL